ncbi:hypothetical protein PIB30_040284 [Stylosanthes scabra]|uniref:O-fucosyltransferase family protein n=1 Tax=Stylosanthes scabra TaxID=79078 RepID=A0ABU6YEW4_9FABA|nr:hypothetical protein [Stylosanthes scabra]
MILKLQQLQSLAKVSHIVEGLQKQNGEQLKPCWNNNPPLPIIEEAKQSSKGFITFSLTNGPHYHISQFAVVVARYLGATLVLPQINTSKNGPTINLGDIYDVESILKKLNEVVRVTRTQPTHLTKGNPPPVVKVPNRVTQDYIVKKVLPIYKSKRMLKIESYFPSSSSVTTTIRGNKNNSMDSFACHAMLTLKLRSEIQEVVDSVVQCSQFVAVDLRAELLRKKCPKRDYAGKSVFYQAKEIAEFLKKIGFGEKTIVYVTQTKWSPNLDAFRHIFPKTWTQESLISKRGKGKLLDCKNAELKKVIDFYVCSESDIYVPSILDLFYTNVAGMRIASGKNQILVPDKRESPLASASDYMSPDISHKSHFVYSCFC